MRVASTFKPTGLQDVAFLAGPNNESEAMRAEPVWIVFDRRDAPGSILLALEVDQAQASACWPPP